MNMFQPKIEITKIDNGYVVEYSQPKTWSDNNIQSKTVTEYVKTRKELTKLIESVA